MSKHTPGPWEVSKMTPVRVDTQDGSIVVNWTCNKDDGKTDRLAEANARLIAAAPLMYEALEEVVGAFADGEVDSHIIEIARAALQAAKGGGDNGE